MVSGCRIQLEQVLVNLIGNAADAMQDSDTKVLTVGTSITADSIYVRVQDSGMGIPPDVLPNVFDPFFTTKAVGAGTGLGLSIAYGIVKALNSESSFHCPPSSKGTRPIQLSP
jgi:two-component system C4-dicarboxylate transport sensor histidine kinase DctB